MRINNDMSLYGVTCAIKYKNDTRIMYGGKGYTTAPVVSGT